MKKITIIICLLLIYFKSYSQIVYRFDTLNYSNIKVQDESEYEVELTDREKEIYHAICHFRKGFNRKPVRLSKKLMYLAKLKVEMLKEFYKDTSISMHSFRDSVFTKKEIKKRPDITYNAGYTYTKYKGYTYEICYYNSNFTNIYSALAGFYHSLGHRAILLNNSIEYESMGFAVDKNFCIIWFGDYKGRDFYIYRN